MQLRMQRLPAGQSSKFRSCHFSVTLLWFRLSNTIDNRIDVHKGSNGQLRWEMQSDHGQRENKDSKIAHPKPGR